MSFFGWLFKRSKRAKSVTLGIALGSGGAKGFAELGALKAFEENGIEFDVVAGTSIGSVIGAFYANGYSVTDIMELLKSIDFGEIKNMLMIKMDTDGMFSTIDRYIGSLTFEELKKPFMVVTTDADTGEETVFSKGNVAKALCASSSYPPFFKPVIIDGKRYIDGAFSNSVPADLVKQMGADYIVGIDLSDHESKPSLLSRIFPTYQGKVEKPWLKGYENSNVMLHPDLSEYKPTSISLGSEMFEIGYRSAVEKLPQIKAEIEILKKGGELTKK